MTGGPRRSRWRGNRLPLLFLSVAVVVAVSSFNLFSPSQAIPPHSSPSLSPAAVDDSLNAWPIARRHSPSLRPRFRPGYQCQPPPRHMVDRQRSGPHWSSTFFLQIASQNGAEEMNVFLGFLHP